MILELTAETPYKDLVIDFIMVQLASGVVVSLNWDESSISRTDNGFEAFYEGVAFNEDYANGRLEELKGLVVQDIGLWSEEDEIPNVPQINIKSMLFTDGDETLEITDIETA